MDERVAQAWLVLSLTHCWVAVGIFALCQFMPFTLFSLIAGVVVDRLDAWRTVIGTQITHMFLASTIAVIALTESRVRGPASAIASLMGLVGGSDVPPRQQLTFRTVGPLELPNSISLRRVQARALGSGRCRGPRCRRRRRLLLAINAVSYVAVIAGVRRPQVF